MANFTLQQAVELAASLEITGDFAKARQIYEMLLQKVPDHGTARSALGALESKQARFQGLTDAPNDTITELANLLAKRELPRVRADARVLVQQFPGSYHLWMLLGSAERFLRASSAAVEAYREAAKLRPRSPAPHEYLGDLHAEQQRVEEAIDCYDRALECDPDRARVRALALYWRVHLCDWSVVGKLDALCNSSAAADKAIEPFKMLALEDDPYAFAERARRYVKDAIARPSEAPAPWPRSGTDRIRVGYFSADFHDHPVMNLISGVFREHDKAGFEIFAFSHGPDSDCELRRRLVEDVEHFVDIRNLSTAETVAKVRSEKIDIAINLTGYTMNARSDAFAARMAPIQISFLGYPATMGGEFMDYIVADRVAIPEAEEAAYVEQVIHMPNSYMPSDNQREIAQVPSSRADHDLPEGAFVFCCFNQPYKIQPRVFDIWMRIMRKVEGSVLWMKQPPEVTAANLRREAELRDVDPARLIFCGRLPLADHIERHRHADLFLDTFNFNAHTTANDALWAGLPVVTRAGRQFAARVAASLVTATGLPELIAETDEDYEALIFDLATHPDKLTAIRARLGENRSTCALFDTARYTRDLETALQSVFQQQS